MSAPSQNSRSSRVFEFPQSPYTTAAATGGGGENGCSADFYCPPACLDTDRSADLRHFPHCDAFRTATLSCTGLSLALCFECSPLCLFGLLALALCSRLSTFDTVFLASSFWHRHHSGTVFLAPSFWHRLSSFLHSSTGGSTLRQGGLALLSLRPLALSQAHQLFNFIKASPQWPQVWSVDASWVTSSFHPQFSSQGGSATEPRLI